MPSLLTKSLAGVRRKDDLHFREHLGDDPARWSDDDHEFLFDNHGYPNAWNRVGEGWARRSLVLGSSEPDVRRILRLDAVAARSEIWFDGVKLGANDDAFLPAEFDVTELAEAGVHEIAVRICDYPRLADDRSKCLRPCGNMLTSSMRGIWQDVWLVARGSVWADNLRVVTSVREGTLAVTCELENAGGDDVSVEVRLVVSRWAAGGDPFAAEVTKAFESIPVVLASGTSRRIVAEIPWSDAPLWEPESPVLHWLRCEVVHRGRVLDRVAERFGFREVWIEGPDLLLNGHPVHLFSDWGHRLSELQWTEWWNRAWFAMIRSENLNHTRLHTHPHPPLVLDLADELGILVTGESAVHGSGGEQAADEPEYWVAAHDHLGRMIARDCNHPSIVLWSVANEMRWNRDKTQRTRSELPRLRELLGKLDPTRPGYHEGDSSLWDESTQPILSRHYGKECGGVGWWDRRQPLHAGEMSSYHYLGPNTNFHTGSADRVWADYTLLAEAAARETAWIVAAGRTSGVLSLGPWNLSCLTNLRANADRLDFQYPDLCSPGAKPRFAHPATAEFLPDGSYRPCGRVNEIQAHSFRPVAVIDLSHRRSYFAGSTITRALTVVNDSGGPCSGDLEIGLKDDSGQFVWARRERISVGRGHAHRCEVRLTLPLKPGQLVYHVRFHGMRGDVVDEWQQSWTLHSPSTEPLEAGGAEIVVIGGGPATRWLKEAGVDFTTRAAFDGPLAGGIVILGPDTVQPGSVQNTWMGQFLQRGGRALLMEQTHSLFPGIRLDARGYLHAFVRGYGHPVLDGVSDEHLEFWGEEAYASMTTDAHVVHRAYRKDARILPLCDTGEGGFGLKLPDWVALGEIRDGEGVLLVSQFRMNDKASTVPEARMLFGNAVRHLLRPPQERVELACADAQDAQEVSRALRVAHRGGNAWVRLRDGGSEICERLGLDPPAHTGPHYHGVRRGSPPVLCGMSNADFCGVEEMTYCFGASNVPVASTSLPASAGLESLVETPTFALLEEMHVHGQRVEALRARAATVGGDKNQLPRTLLGRLRHGRGWVYLDSFLDAPPTHPRLLLWREWLRTNLGHLPDCSSMWQGAVPKTPHAGLGFPTQVCVADCLSAEDGARLARTTVLPAERMAPSGMLAEADWKPEENASGDWLSLPSRAYYCCFRSPRARRVVMEDSGIPNPGSLTFLDVGFSGGAVEAHLNGRCLGQLGSASGPATFADVELAEGFNQLLLLRHGGEPGSTLHFRFRNIQHDAETDLLFLRCNDAAKAWVQLEF